MLALEALPLKVTPTVAPLVGVLSPMLLELGVVRVIHIVLIVLHDLRTTSKEGVRKGDQYCIANQSTLPEQ